MAKHMTISDAVDAYDLYDFFSEFLDAYESDFYARSEIETELRDLIEEHEETYEFTPDEDGDYSESLERNLREALGIIFEEHGVEHLFEMSLPMRPWMTRIWPGFTMTAWKKTIWMKLTGTADLMMTVFISLNSSGFLWLTLMKRKT